MALVGVDGVLLNEEIDEVETTDLAVDMEQSDDGRDRQWGIFTKG